MLLVLALLQLLVLALLLLLLLRDSIVWVSDDNIQDLARDDSNPVRPQSSRSIAIKPIVLTKQDAFVNPIKERVALYVRVEVGSFHERQYSCFMSDMESIEEGDVLPQYELVLGDRVSVCVDIDDLVWVRWVRGGAVDINGANGLSVRRCNRHC